MDSMSERLDHPVYFLTWTTYGTWLPGDERGWVDRDDAANDAPIHEGNESRRDDAVQAMRGDPVLLDADQRDVVNDTVRDVCEHRSWTLYAVNCRTNHLHTVLLASDRDPEAVMNSLKSWCSRHLNEQRGEKRETPWWTRHGSTRWLNTVDEFHRTIDYVLNQQ